MSRTLRLVSAVLAALAAPAVIAQGLEQPEIRTEPIGDGLHVLFAPGAGNVLVSIGESGVLLVDDGVPAVVAGYKETIAGLGGGDVDFVINTHWHFDHADGNKTLGPEGTRLVAHENSRRMMMRDNVINVVRQTIDQPAYPPEAWPTVTYDSSMRMHFNGERIDLLHVGPGHTEGDTAVILPDRNLAHMGDVYLSGGYPFVDADHGGSLIGIVEFCERVLAELESGATVVPGHGAVSDYDGMAEYASMLRTIYERISALVEDGASLEQVIAARPTAEWDEVRGDPSGLIDRTYASLTR
ncbi:MAG TPA: MBL fold metallo-hydrolase [Gammaproteobacteria bacterium]|nr:MBL fold metallo-hydrolase [Gammaproteobacteria bacterium]